MAYPFTDIAELRTYVIATFTANGIKDITGPDAQDALKGILDLCPPILAQQLVAQLGTGVSLGGVSTGQTFALGSPIEALLRALLIKTIPPVYVAPTALLGTSITSLDQEIGSIISPVLTTTFTQNDAGALSGISLKKNNVQIATVSPYTDTAVTIGSTPVPYQAATSYAQGNCKNNNLGATDCAGRIIAGSVNSNIITYNGYRKAFWGVPSIVPVASANIRALSNTLLNPINGSQFSIAIPGASQRVVFAYPDTLQAVSSVKYREGGSMEIKGNFTLSTISVEGASGFTAINYKVYIFEPVEAFPFAATYDVTI